MNQNGNTARRSQASGSEDLEALKRSEISMEEYIERRMEAQVVALGRVLTDEQSAQARDILREHFLDDPVIRHYADMAAGTAPGR